MVGRLCLRPPYRRPGRSRCWASAPAPRCNPPSCRATGSAGPDQVVLGAITLAAAAQASRGYRDRTAPPRARPRVSRSWEWTPCPPSVRAAARIWRWEPERFCLTHSSPPRLGTPSTTPPPGPRRSSCNFRAGVNRRSATAVAQPDRVTAREPVQLRRLPGVGVAAGGDRQLPLDGDHTGRPRLGPGRRCGGRPGADPGGIGSAAATGPGSAQDAGVHATPAGGGRGLAVERGGVDRDGGGRATRASCSGRVLWDLFANEIHAVPAPSVPTVSIVVIAVGALVLANVVAAIPGRMAARTPTALLLRDE